MMKKPTKAEQLVEQHNALTLYLEALLNEVEVDEDEALFDSPHGANEPRLAPVTPIDTLPGIGRSDQPEPPAPVTSSTAPVADITAPAYHGAELDTDSELDKRHEPPDWAIPRFQVLTFSLGGLNMAAPLDKLNGIIPFPERLTVLPGQSQWFLGLARNRSQNVQVIDLVPIIRPHHRVNRADGNPGPNSRYILLIDEGRWGILCDSISTVLTLEPQQVQWQRSHHVEFILGTVKTQMQSVLCIDNLIARLNNAQLV